MRTSLNLALQLTAVVVATGLRLVEPGWLLVLFVFSAVGPVLLVGQLVLATVVLRRPRIPASVATPFGIAAAALVTANLLIADAGDGPRLNSPLEHLTGRLPEAAQGVGWSLLLVWCASLVWALVALVVTAPRRPLPPPSAPALPGLRRAGCP